MKEKELELTFIVFSCSIGITEEHMGSLLSTM